MRRSRSAGFTLIELITVIVISGILATVVWRNVSTPVQSFIDVERRARLTDTAETALARLSRELRLALPNSIRLSGTALEFLRTVDGGRYRSVVAADGSGDALDFSANVDSFDVLGVLQQFDPTNVAPKIAATGQADCLSGAAYCLVIFNTGQPGVCGASPPGANAWCGDNVAGIAQSPAAGQIVFDNSDVPGWSFPFASPRGRFRIVDTPVSFVCAGGTLRRYDGYAISPVQSVPPVGATGRLLADGVSACSFSYDPGTATRSALVTVELALSESGENVRLLQQVHVVNTP